MARYVVNRLAQAIMLLVIVSAIGFAILHMAPGGPLSQFAVSGQMTQEDLDREIQRVARERREPPIAVRQRWEKEGIMQNVASQIRDWKTRNFLFDNARKVAGEMPADPAEVCEDVVVEARL